MHDLLIIGFRTVFLYVLHFDYFTYYGKTGSRRAWVSLMLLSLLLWQKLPHLHSILPIKTNSMPIVPMLILLVIQVVSSYISLKSKKFRDLVDGDPTIIIRHGKIMEKKCGNNVIISMIYFNNYVNNRLALFMMSLLLIWNLREIYPSLNKTMIQPVLALISDGVIQSKHLELIGKTDEWLDKELLI